MKHRKMISIDNLGRLNKVKVYFNNGVLNKKKDYF